MIYKLIILTASLLFIWEFMKVRSTAVAQIEHQLPIWTEHSINNPYITLNGV